MFSSRRNSFNTVNGKTSSLAAVGHFNKAEIVTQELVVGTIGTALGRTPPVTVVAPRQPTHCRHGSHPEAL